MIILTRAPGRIPLGGGGTDLPSYFSKYGGCIISIAINKYTYVLINKTMVDNFIRLKYSESEKVSSVNEIKHAVFREALKLLKIDEGIEIATVTDAPTGTGLGSSGSFTVALLAALHAFKRQHADYVTIAEEACDIEINKAQMACGKQDQYVAALGGAVYLEFATDGKTSVKPLDLGPHILNELKSGLLLFYTGISRESFGIQKEQIKNTEADVKDVVDSLHKTKEIGLEIKKVLERGDLDRFGELLDIHWKNKKRRSKIISNPQVDRWYEIARESGALGGKLIGAGGGGFLAVYCPHTQINKVRQALANEHLKEIEYEFDTDGVKVLVNI